MRVLRRALRGLVPVVATGAIAAAWTVEARDDGATAGLDRIVAGMRRAGRIDRPPVEAALRTALRRTDGTASFAFYRADGIRLDGTTLGVDLRLPITSGGATAGPLLVLRIVGACLRKVEVEARYAPWTLTSAPHGHSFAEETSWTRDEPWGTLSFGFAEGNPDCLRTVAFQGRRPSAPR